MLNICIQLYYRKANILQEINLLALKNQVTPTRETAADTLLPYSCHLKPFKEL